MHLRSKSSGEKLPETCRPTSVGARLIVVRESVLRLLQVDALATFVRETRTRTDILVENRYVEDTAFGDSVNRKVRSETCAIQNDGSAPTHLLKFRPIDESESHVGFDLVDNRDILQVHTATWMESAMTCTKNRSGTDRYGNM